jgi:hypothetical protein
MHPDVDWPNGMDGGRVQGHDAVREYWTRQWRSVDPHVTPVRFVAEDGRIVVDVRQVIRDRAGKLVREEMVQHVYRLEDGRVRSMEIRKLPRRTTRARSAGGRFRMPAPGRRGQAGPRWAGCEQARRVCLRGGARRARLLRALRFHGGERLGTAGRVPCRQRVSGPRAAPRRRPARGGPRPVCRGIRVAGRASGTPRALTNAVLVPTYPPPKPQHMRLTAPQSWQMSVIGSRRT